MLELSLGVFVLAEVNLATDRSLHRWRHFGMSFALVYLSLYAFPFPLTAFDWANPIVDPIYGARGAIVDWIGNHVLHLSLQGADGADSSNGYFAVVVFAAIALLIASALERFLTPARIAQAHEWMRLYVRYYLLIAIVSYGFLKVYPSQFPFPKLELLMLPLSSFGPGGLLWVFVGYSRAYSLSAGLLEVIGGLLLCSRRTTPAGAFVLLFAVGNVVAFNLAYDVNLKLFTIHLWLMALCLLAPTLGSLVNILVLGRPVAPAPAPPPLLQGRRAALVLTLLVTAFLVDRVWTYATLPHAIIERRGYLRSKPPHYGIYEVEELKRDGVAAPLLKDAAGVWSEVIVDVESLADDALVIRMMDGNVDHYRFHDAGPAPTQFWTKEKPDLRSELSIAQLDETHFLLRGTFAGRDVSARLRKIDAAQLKLLRQRFRWTRDK